MPNPPTPSAAGEPYDFSALTALKFLHKQFEYVAGDCPSCGTPFDTDHDECANDEAWDCVKQTLAALPPGDALDAAASAGKEAVLEAARADKRLVSAFLWDEWPSVFLKAAAPILTAATLGLREKELEAALIELIEDIAVDVGIIRVHGNHMVAALDKARGAAGGLTIAERNVIHAANVARAAATGEAGSDG